MAAHPTALISYSHDSAAHEQGVLVLCNRLRESGVDAFIDQFLPGAPSEGWPLWMEREIERRDFTLLVCTEAYRRRVMDIEAEGIGRGVVWEARILRNLLYENTDWHHRIVPVLLDPAAAAHVPTIFRGNYYDVSDQRGFENLLRHLTREPGASPGILGVLGPRGSRWSAFQSPWLIPDALRTQYFTGRDDVLARLNEELKNRHRAAICGLGGMGKTQTAIEYAVQRREQYSDGVFWVNAQTLGGLTSGFIAIASALRLPSAESNDQDKVVNGVKTWLETHDEWLLILDNVEDREELRHFLPARSSGDVLITSRESVFSDLGIPRAFDIGDLDANAAVTFLLSRAGRDEAGPQDRAAAAELALELGYLPLALTQAAAYVAETNAAFADYLSALRKRRITLLEKAVGLIGRDTVAVTWAANFEAVERASAAAAELLRMSAMLSTDAIPYELFDAAPPSFGGPLAEHLTDADEMAMAELLRPLTRYSLVRSDSGTRTFGVHRLVQEIVRSMLTEEERRSRIEWILNALDAVFPEVDFSTWVQCERLLPHVTAIADTPYINELYSEAAGRLLNRTGRYLWERGRYSEARVMFERALSIDERVKGSNHIDVARSLDNLGIAHSRQGHYADAQALLQRSLAIYERALGANHIDVARRLNNIANVYYEQGRYADAQPLHERALSIRQSVLGASHPDVGASLNNLGIVNYCQGQYAEAKSLYERALTIWEGAYGPDHPNLAQTLDNLGETDLKLGLRAEGEALLARGLASRERSLGPNHPQVAESLNSLGNVYREEGRHAEAKAHYRRAAEIWERALGSEHPDFAVALNNLGFTLLEEGCYKDAEANFERAGAIAQRALGPGHPEFAKNLLGLAKLRKRQRRTAEAQTLYHRALAAGGTVLATDSEFEELLKMDASE